MNVGRLFGGASRYAHLAALVPARGARAEDDTDDKETKGKKSKADEDEDDDDAPKGKKSKADDAPDQMPDEDDNEPKGKKSKAEDDDETCEEDDDDKEEMSGKSAAASARRRERARCKAIIGHSAAARNLELAASLAFDTDLTRQQALKVLKGQTARPGAHDVRGDRRGRNPDLGPGGESAPTGAQAVRSSWDRAHAKAGVVKPGK